MDKIENYQRRHKSGEDISEELYQLLNVWLMNHIAEDDESYMPSVKENIMGINTSEIAGWLKTKVQH